MGVRIRGGTGAAIATSHSKPGHGAAGASLSSNRRPLTTCHPKQKTLLLSNIFCHGLAPPPSGQHHVGSPQATKLKLHRKASRTTACPYITNPKVKQAEGARTRPRPAQESGSPQGAGRSAPALHLMGVGAALGSCRYRGAYFFGDRTRRGLAPIEEGVQQRQIW